MKRAARRSRKREEKRARTQQPTSSQNENSSQTKADVKANPQAESQAELDRTVPAPGVPEFVPHCPGEFPDEYLVNKPEEVLYDFMYLKLNFI